MAALRQFLHQLRSLPEEVPIEPELKYERQKKDKQLKEDQDLQSGAVMEATLETGEGGNTPKEGDLVYCHVSIRRPDDEGLLYSTRSDSGGSGQALAFVIGKGRRAPRAWELSLLGMTRGERRLLQVAPSFGFAHPECSMPPPKGVPRKEALVFDLALVRWYGADDVRTCGEAEDAFKRVLVEADSWETARPPNEVTFGIKVCCPASGGLQLSGFCYFQSPPQHPLSLQLGQGLLPEGLEMALGSMVKGETAVFVLPAALMAPPPSGPPGGGAEGGAGLLPPPPSSAQQVEVELRLLEQVQVRDMVGDGGVLKRRLRPGSGDFPVDCPIYDTRMRLHYRARRLALEGGGSPGPWLLDTLAEGSAAATQAAAAAAPAVEAVGATATAATAASLAGSGCVAAGAAWGESGGGAPPVEVDLGCGELPEGLEVTLKMMVPGEVASAVCRPEYAYQGRTDAPAGIAGEEGAALVEFQAVLLSFDKEGYWQNLEWEERYSLAERMKSKGNELYKAGKYEYAIKRYQRLLHLLDSTRDYEAEEQVARIEAFKAAVLSNLALCSQQLGEYAAAVEWCNKALELDPGSAKVAFRRGKALSQQGEFEQAEQQLRAAADLDPSIGADVEAALAANRARAKAAAAKQKQQFRSFFDRN